MNLSLDTFWLLGHLLSMVGAFGSLLLVQAALPTSSREDIAVIRPASRLVNTLLGVGVVFGLLAYSALIRGAKASGEELASVTHMVVGIKFVLLLLIGGAVGASSAMTRKARHGPANGLRWIAILLFAAAALLGLSRRG